MVNEPDDDGFTPLWRAARNGRLDVIKFWIASGRKMDLGKPGDVGKTDAIGIAVLGAKSGDEIEVATLLRRFKENPEETRHRVRQEMGWYDEAAAEMFALVELALKTPEKHLKPTPETYPNV